MTSQEKVALKRQTATQIEKLLIRYAPYSGGRIDYCSTTEVWYFDLGGPGKHVCRRGAHTRLESYALLFAMRELSRYSKEGEDPCEIYAMPDGRYAAYALHNDMIHGSPAAAALLLLCELPETEVAL